MTAETQIIISAQDLATDTFRNVGLASETLIRIFERAQGLVPFAGASLGVHGLKAFIEHQVEYIDKSGKMAQITGMNTQTFLEFQYAAMLADLSSESLSKGVGKLSKNMVAAADGSGDAYDAFHALGIGVKDSTGQLKGADQILEEIADRFAEFEDGPAKTAMAMALFGKGGAEMIPLLNKGAQELRHLREEAEKTGYAFGDNVAKQAEEVNDNFKRLHTRTDALKTLFVSGMLPALISTSEYMLHSASASDKLRENLEGVEKTVRGIAFAIILAKNAIDMVGEGSYRGALGGTAVMVGNFKLAKEQWEALNKGAWDDMHDIERAWDEIWKGGEKRQGMHSLTYDEHMLGKKKPQAPVIKKDDNGEGISTIKTLREEAFKAEAGLRDLQHAYDELSLTMAGDSYGATLLKNQRDHDKERLEALREYIKLDDQRRVLAAKGKLTGEAAGLIDRAQAASAAKLTELERLNNLRDQQAYDKDRVARLQSSAALAELTGRTWDHRNAQAELLKIEIALAQTAEERALKEQQLADVLAQRDGDWVDASRKALQAYESSARDTWTNVYRMTANVAQSMEDAMVDSAMQTENAWVNAWRAIEREIVRVIYRQSVMAQLAKYAGGFINDGISGLFGTPSADVGASDVLNEYGDFMGHHRGGMAGSEPTFTRRLPLSAFAGAPRYHTGGVPGLDSTERAVIVQNTEGIFTEGQMRALGFMAGAGGGGAPAQVTNHNYYDFRGADTGTETRIRAMLAASERRSTAQSLLQVEARANRGGKFSRTVGRRQ